MVDEYRKRRRNEPEFKELVELCAHHVNNSGITGTDREPSDYILPGRCYKGHSINADFLIDLELSEIPMFVLRNTHPNPYDDPKNNGVGPPELFRRYEELKIEVEMPGSSGAHMLKLGPARCLPIPFAADGDINPRPLEGSGLALEFYEHWNPLHNRTLNTRAGSKGLQMFGDPDLIGGEVKKVVKAK